MSERLCNPTSPVRSLEGEVDFAVIVPTHQNSKTLGLAPDGAEGPLFWRSRAGHARKAIDARDRAWDVVASELAGQRDTAATIEQRS